MKFTMDIIVSGEEFPADSPEHELQNKLKEFLANRDKDDYEKEINLLLDIFAYGPNSDDVVRLSIIDAESGKPLNGTKGFGIYNNLKQIIMYFGMLNDESVAKSMGRKTTFNRLEEFERKYNKPCYLFNKSEVEEAVQGLINDGNARRTIIMRKRSLSVSHQIAKELFEKLGRDIGVDDYWYNKQYDHSKGFQSVDRGASRTLVTYSDLMQKVINNESLGLPLEQKILTLLLFRGVRMEKRTDSNGCELSYITVGDIKFLNDENGAISSAELDIHNSDVPRKIILNNIEAQYLNKYLALRKTESGKNISPDAAIFTSNRSNDTKPISRLSLWRRYSQLSIKLGPSFKYIPLRYAGAIDTINKELIKKYGTINADGAAITVATVNAMLQYGMIDHREYAKEMANINLSDKETYGHDTINNLGYELLRQRDQFIMNQM